MRVAGTIEADGSTIKLKQGGNSTTITEGTPSGDITLTLPKDANANILGVEHGGDTTKAVKVTSDGATTAKTLTIDTNHTDNRTLTLPDATDTLVGRATTDTLTNKTLSSPTITVADNALTVQDNADATKQLQLELSGITTGTTRTLTVPDASTTIVGTDATQTLTNKTLTAPVISSISNSGTLTLPSSTDTLVGRATTDTLTNKTLTAPTISAGSHILMDDQASIRFEDDSGNEYIQVQAPSGVTTYTIKLPATQGAVSEVLGNDGSGNLSWMAALTNSLNDQYIFIGNSSNESTAVDTGAVGDITADTATGLTINSGVSIDSPVLTTPQINDTSADHQYVFAASELAADRTVTLPLLTADDEFVFASHAKTLQNKTIGDAADATKALDFDLSGATTAKTVTLSSSHTDDRTITIPDASTTLVGTDTTQTLTNKTLTSPVISSISNSGTLTLPTSTDTLVGRDTTDTLTNKTLSGGTLSGTFSLDSTPNEPTFSSSNTLTLACPVDATSDFSITRSSNSGHIKLERTSTSTGTVWVGTAAGDLRVGTSSGATDIIRFLSDGRVAVNTASWGTGGTAVGVSSGALTLSPSSQRYKENIVDLTAAVDTSKLYELRPVEYDYKSDGKHSFGYIAEEVAQILPCITHMEDYGNGPIPESVSYQHITILLVEEMKKLRARIEELEAKS